MRYTLIKKEFRQLLPVAILIIIFFTAQLIYNPVSGRLDEDSWSKISGYLEPDSQVSSSIVLIILCLMTSFSLFPREYDDRTIEYLYSLPISRNAVFFSKFIVALSILYGAMLLGCLADYLLQLFNKQPFSGTQFNLRTAVTGYFLMSAFIFIMMSYGVLLSFFRRFGILILGLFWIMISTFKDRFPFFEYLNIFNIVKMDYHGQTLLIPWKLLFFNIGMGSVCLLMAGFLWNTPAEQFSMWYARLQKKRLGTIIGFASLILIITLFLIIFVRLIKSEESNNIQKVQYISYQTSTFSTDHYRFTYPQSLSETARQLIDQSDEVYIKTRDFLSAGDSEPIVVDLTEQSNEHAGLAGLYKIRMDIRKEKELKDRLRVFTHETTHVFSLLESDKKIRDFSNSTHFFNEGLSEFVSYTLIPDTDKLEMQRLLAAVSWKRYHITFDNLVNEASFRKKYSEHLFYAIGELWVKAMSDTYGDKAVSDLLRAMGREGAPTNLSGHTFWQDTLQAMGSDLEKINTTWLKLLTDLSRKYEKKIEELPQIRGGVSSRNRDVTILSAHLDRQVDPDNLDFLVRYRSNSSVGEEDTHVIYGLIQPDTEPLEIQFHIPSNRLISRKFEYQFGYIFDGRTFPYFEEWQSGDNR